MIQTLCYIYQTTGPAQHAWIQREIIKGMGCVAAQSINFNEYCPKINVKCSPQANIFENSPIFVAFGALFRQSGNNLNTQSNTWFLCCPAIPVAIISLPSHMVRDCHQWVPHGICIALTPSYSLPIFILSQIIQLIFKPDISVVLGHACARYTSRKDAYHFHHSPMSYVLGFRPSSVQSAQKMRAAPPPEYREYEQIRANTLPRRSTNGSWTGSYSICQCSTTRIT